METAQRSSAGLHGALAPPSTPPASSGAARRPKSGGPETSQGTRIRASTASARRPATFGTAQGSPGQTGRTAAKGPRNGPRSRPGAWIRGWTCSFDKTQSEISEETLKNIRDWKISF